MPDSRPKPPQKFVPTEQQYQQALERAFEGDVAGATSLLRELLAVETKEDHACAAGIFMWRIKKYGLAEMCYKRALELGQSPEVLFNYAITLDDAHRPEEAIDVIRRYIRSCKSRFELLGAKGMLQRTGKHHLQNVIAEAVPTPFPTTREDDAQYVVRIMLLDERTSRDSPLYVEGFSDEANVTTDVTRAARLDFNTAQDLVTYLRTLNADGVTGVEAILRTQAG